VTREVGLLVGAYDVVIVMLKVSWRQASRDPRSRPFPRC
jgi:hypothetical protein